MGSIRCRRLLREDLLTFFCATSCIWSSSSCQSHDAVPSKPGPFPRLGSSFKHCLLAAQYKPSLFRQLKAPWGQDPGFIHAQIDTDAEQRASCPSTCPGRPEIPAALQRRWDLLPPRLKARKSNLARPFPTDSRRWVFLSSSPKHTDFPAAGFPWSRSSARGAPSLGTPFCRALHQFCSRGW